MQKTASLKETPSGKRPMGKTRVYQTVIKQGFFRRPEMELIENNNTLVALGPKTTYYRVNTNAQALEKTQFCKYESNKTLELTSIGFDDK